MTAIRLSSVIYFPICGEIPFLFMNVKNAESPTSGEQACLYHRRSLCCTRKGKETAADFFIPNHLSSLAAIECLVPRSFQIIHV